VIKCLNPDIRTIHCRCSHDFLPSRRQATSSTSSNRRFARLSACRHQSAVIDVWPFVRQLDRTPCALTLSIGNNESRQIARKKSGQIPSKVTRHCTKTRKHENLSDVLIRVLEFANRPLAHGAPCRSAPTETFSKNLHDLDPAALTTQDRLLYAVVIRPCARQSVVQTRKHEKPFSLIRLFCLTSFPCFINDLS
jgi:hypothetical protein